MEGANLPNTDDTRWSVRPFHGGHVGVLQQYSKHFHRHYMEQYINGSYPRSSIVSIKLEMERGNAYYTTCNVRYNVLACVHWCSLQAFFYMEKIEKISIIKFFDRNNKAYPVL